MTPFATLQNKLRTLVALATRSTRRRVVAALGVGLSISVVATAAVWSGWQSSSPAPTQLASIVPQGALLTIESKDFSSLLKQWDESKEKAAWLKSDDYAVFSRSRLFGRLGDAQKEFALSAGLPPDMNFLHEVAGSDSIFAWYDVGKLESLYATRMPSGDAERSRLFGLRGKFTRRQIGATTFYVRSTGGANSANPSEPQEAGAANSEQAEAPMVGGQERTVAFAVSGDWLLLATREDLMAEALTLLAKSSHPAPSDKPATTEAKDTLLPLSAEPWFQDARAAAAREPGEMRMTLNLEKIVRTPYFQSYWIQQNESEIKQYRGAVCDLYLKSGSSGGGVFREERVLLPKSAADEGAAASDLTAVTALLPQHTGVYRAIAAPSVDAAIGALDEKLLARAPGKYVDPRFAPDADVQVHPAGTSLDLETRIDATPLARPAAASELQQLRQTLTGADLQAMMTVSRTGASKSDGGIWVPFQSAVVLSSSKDWDANAMQAALQHSLAAHITTSNLGLAWKPVKVKSGTYLEISNTRPLEMAVHGKLLVLSDDPDLMVEMMDRMGSAIEDKQHGKKSGPAEGARTVSAPALKGTATLIAGFDTTEERGAFGRWTALVDHNQGSPAVDGSNNAPGFFSGNMRSLDDVFSDLTSERVVESRDGALTRQTVTYAWQH